MASKAAAPLAIFLTLNIMFFTLTTATCPTDTLKIGACLNALNLVKLTVGSPEVTQCCSLVSGLADLEAAVCLCTIINTKILGISLTLPVDINVLLNNCGYSSFSGYKCP